MPMEFGIFVQGYIPKWKGRRPIPTPSTPP